jgi:hypothetical protein
MNLTIESTILEGLVLPNRYLFIQEEKLKNIKKTGLILMKRKMIGNGIVIKRDIMSS